MGRRRISGDELPSDGVAIGGDQNCEHSEYERIGSDGGANIYFNCTQCSRVVLKYSAVEEEPLAGRSESDGSDLYPDSDSRPRHDPLVKGLSFDMDQSDGSSGSSRSESEGSGPLERIRRRLERAFDR